MGYGGGFDPLEGKEGECMLPGNFFSPPKLFCHWNWKAIDLINRGLLIEDKIIWTIAFIYIVITSG